MVAGIAVAVAGVALSVKSLADDVNGLARNADVGELVTNLEGGEYFVYDEDGFDLGLFDVRVFRASDGAELATQAVPDPVSYDVNGRNGTAKVRFRVPSSDLYRVEVETGAGQVAKFALGGNVSPVRDRLVGGLALGIVLFLVGLVALIWTGLSHARWVVRNTASQTVAQGRDAVGRVLGEGGTTEKISDRVSERFDEAANQARGSLYDVRESIVGERARELFDAAEASISGVESLAQSQVEGVDPAALAGAIDVAMARVEERLAAGESLRKIVREEGLEAGGTLKDLRDRAERAVSELTDQAEAASLAGRFDVDEEVVAEVVAEAVAELSAQAAASVPGLLDIDEEEAVAEVADGSESAPQPAIVASLVPVVSMAKPPTRSAPSERWTRPGVDAEPDRASVELAPPPAAQSAALLAATPAAGSPPPQGGLLAPPPAYRPLARSDAPVEPTRERDET
jgi:hypothetical protein